MFEALAYSKKTAKTAFHKDLDQTVLSAFQAAWERGGDALTSALRRQRICTENGLESMNWVLNLPLEQSAMIEDIKAVFVKDEPEETKPEVRLARDTKAPLIEMSFKTSAGAVPGATEEGKSHTVGFTKVGLQGFFEELEKIQVKLDETTS